MAKFFLLSTALLLAVASARNTGFQKQNGNNRPMENGNFGARQESGFEFSGNKGGFGGSQGGFLGNQEGFPRNQGGFPGMQGGKPGKQGGFPGSQGGFPGRQGGQGFPGQHGHGGHGHGPHLPPFLSNVTKEALEELHSIMKNEELTKAELEAQINSWAATQGEEIAQKFAEMHEERKQKEQAAKERINEMLATVTDLLPKIEAIKSNMEITRAEEREQIMALFAEASPSVMHLLKMLEKEAKKETMTPPEVPEMPEFPEVPEVPEVPEAASFGGFSGARRMF